VGFVFQQFNLFPHMTAIGNVMEGLRTVRGQREAEAKTRAYAAVAKIQWQGAFVRSDIGWRALNR